MNRKSLTSFIQIYFAKQGIKLFLNEPHKMNLNGKMISVHGIGYPKGSPDLMGWSVHSGVVVGVEIKTEGDTLKKDQKDFHDVMVKDNCIVYIAHYNDGFIELKCLNSGVVTRIEA